MIANLLISFIEWLGSFFLDFVPEFTGTNDVITNAQAGMEMVVNFVRQVNFIVPLPDIMLILVIDSSIRLQMFIIYLVNWIKNVVVGLIP